jgi:hypothetical protein
MPEFFNKQPGSRLGTNSVIAPAGSSVSTGAFGAQTYEVRVVATAAVNIKIGDGSVAATTNDPLLPASIPEYFVCTPGQKLAAIGTATVHVTECS